MFKKLPMFLSISIFFQFNIYATEFSEEEEKNYQLGIDYRDGKNFIGSRAEAQRKAVELFSPLASKGHTKSQYNLGYIFNMWGDAYYKKNNYPAAENFYKQAHYWFEEAKDKGFDVAVTSLKTLEEKLNSRNYFMALPAENIALVLAAMDEKSLLSFLQTCHKGLECVDAEFRVRSCIKCPLKSFNNDPCPATKSYYIRKLFEKMKDLPIGSPIIAVKYNTEHYQELRKNTIRYKKASELWKALGYQGLGQLVFSKLGNANFSQFSNNEADDLSTFTTQASQIRSFVYDLTRKLTKEKDLINIDNIDESESLFAILTKYKLFPREIPEQQGTDWEKEQRAELAALINHAKKLIQAGHPEVVKYYMDTALREIGYEQSSPNYFKQIQDELSPLFKQALEDRSPLNGEDN